MSKNITCYPTRRLPSRVAFDRLKALFPFLLTECCHLATTAVATSHPSFTTPVSYPNTISKVTDSTHNYSIIVAPRETELYDLLGVPPSATPGMSRNHPGRSGVAC